MTPVSIALNRFGLGARPSDTIGEPRRWLEAQLAAGAPRLRSDDASGSTTAAAARLVAGYGEEKGGLRRAGADAATFEARRRVYAQTARGLYDAAVRARVDAALATDTPLVERLVNFWSNHFAVAAKSPAMRAFAGSFEAEAIRPHVLGTFGDLLNAAERHPAMLAYLDQTRSTGPDSPAARRRTDKPIGLNENLAREILELHTLGVRTVYTQADVTEFARALTGWGTVGIAGIRDEGAPDAFGFAMDRHQPGDRTILGKRYPQDGAEQGGAVLRDLAVQPATARHIAIKLTRHFAGAPEPAAMVDRVAVAFAASKGDLPTVYRAVIASPEAWTPRALRIRTPWEWAVAVLRASGARSFGEGDPVGLFVQLGQPVWQPLQPSGWDDDDASWAAPDALIRRVEEAERLASALPQPFDARAVADRVFPGAVTPATAEALARAESPAQAAALLFCAPEMMRR